MTDSIPTLAATKETLVCVGGPYDGRRVEIDKGREFLQVAVIAKLTFTEPVLLSDVGGFYFTYRRQVYQAGGEFRTFLAPNADEPGETLNRLIDGYRQPAPVHSRTGL